MCIVQYEKRYMYSICNPNYLSKKEIATRTNLVTQYSNIRMVYVYSICTVQYTYM